MKLTAICMVSAATLLSALAAEPRLRTLDMVHHNPGEKPTQSKFLEPAYLAAMGSGAKVVNDFQATDCATLFDGWFATYHISQDHNSIDPAPGMDAEVDRYRKMMESK